MEALGYWREPIPEHKTGDTLTWLAPGRFGLKVWVGVLYGRPVARISRQPAHGTGCSASIDGWAWTVMEPGSAADRMGIKESPYRGFRTVQEAKSAIEAAIRTPQLVA